MEHSIDLQENRLADLERVLEECQLESSSDSEGEDAGLVDSWNNKIRIKDIVVFDNPSFGGLKGVKEGEVIGLTKKKAQIHVKVTTREGTTGITWRLPSKVTVKDTRRRRKKLSYRRTKEE